MADNPDNDQRDPEGWLNSVRRGYNVGEWLELFATNHYFAEYQRFWRDVIQEFGTVNIYYILGVGDLAGPLNNFAAHMRSQETIDQMRLGIRRRRDVEQRIVDLHAENPDPEQISEELLRSSAARVSIYNNFEIMLGDEAQREAYIQAMESSPQLGGYWLDFLTRDDAVQVGEQRALRVALRTMWRRDMTDKCYNCGQSGHFARNCPRPRLCRHCHANDHLEVVCPQGGYMRRGEGGRPTPNIEDGKPKCYCCGERHVRIRCYVGGRRISFDHSSWNCPHRNLESFKPIQRRCRACRGVLERCWNCGMPSCRRNFNLRGPAPLTNCEGHGLGGCPLPRYNPQLSESRYGPNAHQRLSRFSQLRELGLHRTSREQRHPSESVEHRWGRVTERWDMIKRFLEQRDHLRREHQHRRELNPQQEREFVLLAQMQRDIERELPHDEVRRIVGDRPEYEEEQRQEEHDAQPHDEVFLNVGEGPEYEEEEQRQQEHDAQPQEETFLDVSQRPEYEEQQRQQRHEAPVQQPAQVNEEPLEVFIGTDVGENELPRECFICRDHKEGALFCLCSFCKQPQHADCLYMWTAGERQTAQERLHGFGGEQYIEPYEVELIRGFYYCPFCRQCSDPNTIITLAKLDISEAEYNAIVGEGEESEWEDDPDIPQTSQGQRQSHRRKN